MTAERKPQGEPGKMPESNKIHVKMPVPWRMYLAIIILGLTTISMVSYGFYKGQTMAATYAPLVDAAMEIKFEATTSHLLLEEILNEERFGDIDPVWRHLDQADWYAQAMLEGGRSAEGIFVPLKDAHLRAEIRKVRKQLLKLRKATQQRLDAGKRGGIKSEVDWLYNAAFADLIKQADDVETQLQILLTSDLRRFRRMQWALIVICFLLWLTIGLILHRFVRRQSVLLRASNEANESLVVEIALRERTEEELRASKAILQAAMDNCQAGIAIADAPDGKLRYVNKAGLMIPEKSREEVVENVDLEHYAAIWQLFDLDGKPLAEDEVPLTRSIKYGETCTKEIIVRRSPNDDRIVWANSAPVFDDQGKMTAGIAVFLDITDQRRAELTLQKTQTELIARERRERELVETELAKTRKELVSATRLATLGQLTATVSHELRNPLGSIRTAVFSVAEEVRGHAPLVDRALARAERNIIRCDQIIEELLDYTRTKKPEPKLTDIDPWLGKVLDEQNIPEHIELIRNFNAGVEINVDREQLRRCLINLLTNAFQAMLEPQASQARLTVETLREEGRLAIHVRDTGRGISADKMERIFEPLYTTKGFGIGLGLPVVEQLMKQLDGGVTIKSRLDQGTTASLWLPLDPQKDQQEKDES